MDPHRSIQLHPYSPPTRTQNQLSSDEYSDFPPIREHNSTPDPQTPTLTNRSRYRPSAVQNYLEHRSSPSQSPGPRFPQRSRLPNKSGLGRNNIVNTIKLTVQQGDNVPESSSKRRLESLDNVDNNRRLKRQCLDLKDDMDWVKAEIGDIKECMRDIKVIIREIADHLRGDVDLKLEEIIDRIRQLE